MRIRLAFKFLFYFCGTCLHELAHYSAALFLGKAEGFSVIPKIEGNQFVLGSVRSTVRYRVLSAFIAAAPLSWWAILFLILLHLHIIRLSNGIPEIHLGMTMNRLKAFSFLDAAFLWIFTQLLWAGKLSIQDIKNVFKGVFSFSGFIFLAAVAISVYLYQR